MWRMRCENEDMKEEKREKKGGINDLENGMRNENENGDL